MGGNPAPIVAATPPQPHIQTQPPFIAFQPGNVPPSQFVYLQLNDFLAVNCLSNTANIQMQVKYRYLTPQSEIKEGTANFTITGTFSAFSFQIGEGWLLGLALISLNATAGTFVHAQLVIVRVPASVANNNVYQLIWEGYVPSQAAASWPGTPAKDPTDGMGVLRSVTGSTPAAGADISESVPGNRRWQLIAFRATLNTSAAVASRVPQFTLDDGANIFFSMGPNTTEPASQAFKFVFAPGMQLTTDQNQNLSIPAPNVTLLKGGFRIRTITANIQAADQWTAPQYLIQEWASWDL